MRFSFSKCGKFVVKTLTHSRQYPMSAIDCFLWCKEVKANG